MRMRAEIVAEAQFKVGQALVVQGDSPKQHLSAVFEDDGDTGYFYALHHGMSGNPIVDGLHIYNAQGVTDREKPCLIQIAWSSDGMKAVLLINEYAHAVFDFVDHRGYCRTGFP